LVTLTLFALALCVPTADGREVFMADEAYDEVRGVPEVSFICF
jgi:hypothetical protein